MQKKSTRTLFFIGAIPLLFAIVAATYYGSQGRPSQTMLAELKNIAPLGEVLKFAPVEQHFKCPVDKLESFNLMAATYVRRNTARYKVSINGGWDYRAQEFEIDSAQLKDNAWIGFTLKKPLERCKGRPLQIKIESEDATSGNAITFYTASRYYEGKLMLPIRADLQNRQLALEINSIVPSAEPAAKAPSVTVAPAIPVATATLAAGLDNLDHFGEVLAANPIEQSISCPVEKLNAIKVMAATYVRNNSAIYKFSLAEGNEKPQTMTVDSRAVNDNSWVMFKLPTPIEKCFGKPLTLKITALSATTGNAITFYHRPSYYEGKLKLAPESKLQGRQLMIEMNR